MKLKSRAEIIGYLEEKNYSRDFEYWPISWRIKVDDTSFRYGEHPDVETDPKWDDKWEAYVEDGGWMFHAACRDWLGFTGKPNDYDILDSHPDQSLANSKPVFYTRGRSGGWLVLDSARLNGWRYGFQDDYQPWFDMDYLDLWVLYKLCIYMDSVVELRHDYLREWYAQQRAEMEIEWAETEEPHGRDN